MKQSQDELRYIFDEDCRGVGLALSRIRKDMTCIGEERVAADLPLEIKDPDWIPVVARLKLIAITKNYRIRTQPKEAQKAIEHGLVAVCLFPTDHNASRWTLSELIFRHWSKIEELDGGAGPMWLELRDRGAIPRDYAPGQSNRALRASRRNK